MKLIKTCVRIQLPHRSATQPHQSTAVYRAFNSSPPKIELKYGHRIFINFPGHKKDLVSLLCLAGFPLNLLAITRVRIAFSRLAEFQIPPSHGVEWWWTENLIMSNLRCLVWIFQLYKIHMYTIYDKTFWQRLNWNHHPITNQGRQYS